MDDLERILTAATKHGDTDPDMEIGDLQQLARDLWKILTPEQRKAFFDRTENIIDWVNFLEQWE
jgi:hypothetical protein